MKYINPEGIENSVVAKSSRKILFPALFFLFASFVFFPSLFFGDRVFLGRMGDLHLVNYSWAVYFSQMIRQGIWPLWNPLSFAGCPFGAGSVSSFSLMNALSVLLNDAPTAWNVQVLINVFLAAMGTYLYMKKMGISTWGALIAGVLFAFLPSSGSYIDSWPFFIPIGLWLLEEFYSSRRKFILILLVFNFLAMILNALPQYTLYAGMFFAIYAFARFRSFLGIYILIFAGGLASFSLFRLLELLSFSPRGKMWFVSVLSPVHLVNVVLPFLFESPFRPESNFFFHKLLGEVARRWFYQGNIEWLYPPYMTIAGFSFVLCAWRLKGSLRFFRTALIWGMLYLITFPLLAPLYKNIPILAQLPRVGRLFSVLTFCIAVLAGWGADKIFKKEFRLKPIAVFYAILCGTIFAGLAIVRLTFQVFQVPLRGFFTNFIQAHIVHNAAYRASESFYLERIDQFFSFINAWTRWNDPSVLAPAILIAVFLLLLAAWRHDKIRKTFFSAAILLLVVLDVLFVFRAAQNTTASRLEITAASPAIQFLQKQPGLFRVTTILEESAIGVGRERDILAPNLNLHYGLYDIEGYDPMFPGRYSEFIKNFQKQPEQDPAMILSGPENGFDPRVMDYLNVRYFFTKKTTKLKKTLPLVFSDDRNSVYLNPSCLPRAYLVTDYRQIREKDSILRYLRDPSFDFQRSVILEDKPRFPVKPAASKLDPRNVVFDRSEPDHIQMEVRAGRDSILVLSDNYYPGWKAFLDGNETRILRANYAFRAIEIPQGEHKVELFFRPMSYRLGWAVSSIFLIVGCLVLTKLPAGGRRV